MFKRISRKTEESILGFMFPVTALPIKTFATSFKRAFREFIKEYSHRAFYELDIINPRLKENPSYLIGIRRSTLNTADLRG